MRVQVQSLVGKLRPHKSSGVPPTPKSWHRNCVKLELYWDIITLIHLWIVHVCFHATVAELNTCNLSTVRNHIKLQEGFKYKVAEDLQPMKSTDRVSEGDLPKQRQLHHRERKAELMLESLLRTGEQWLSLEELPGELIKMKNPRPQFTEITF